MLGTTVLMLVPGGAEGCCVLVLGGADGGGLGAGCWCRVERRGGWGLGVPGAQLAHVVGNLHQRAGHGVEDLVVGTVQNIS